MRRDHPLVLLCYFGTVLVLSMLTMHPLWIGTAFVSGCVVSGILSGWHALVKRLPGLVLFALGVALLNPLISHNGVTPLLFFRGNPITLEALCYGAVLGGLLSSLLLWGSIYSHLVDGEKILWLLGAVLPQAALLFSVAMRYLPALQRRYQQLHRLHTCMGLYRQDTFLHRLKGSFQLLSVLLGSALEDAVQTAYTMRARGYGSGKRTRMSLYRMRKREWTQLGCILLLTVCIGILLHRGAMQAQFYPRMVFQVGAGELAVAAGLGLLLLLPGLEEGGAWIRWHLWKPQHSALLMPERQSRR